MWNDKSKFYNEIFQFSKVPAPDLNIELNANPSMKEPHLRLMKKFNEWVELFSRHGVYQGQLPQQAKQALDIIRFTVRYSLEAPSPALEKQIAPVETNLPDCEIDLAHIAPGFLSKIKHSYKRFIQKNEF